MTSKHSTPWSFDATAYGNYCIRNVKGEWVANNEEYENTAPSLEDAKFIVKAVNHYGELVEMVQELIFCISPHERCIHAVNKANNLLNKLEKGE